MAEEVPLHSSVSRRAVVTAAGPGVVCTAAKEADLVAGSIAVWVEPDWGYTLFLQHHKAAAEGRNTVVLQHEDGVLRLLGMSSPVFSGATRT